MKRAQVWFAMVFLTVAIGPAQGFAEESPCEREAQADPNNQGCEANGKLSVLKTALNQSLQSPSLPTAASYKEGETPFTRPAQGVAPQQRPGRDSSNSSQ